MVDGSLIQLQNQLEDHEKRIRQLEMNGNIPEREEGGERCRISKPKARKTDLSSPIQELYNGGFFKEWRTDNDVVKKLKQQVLTARRASVSNVLRRFATPKRGLLERDGNGTKKAPWRYRNKHEST